MKNSSSFIGTRGFLAVAFAALLGTAAGGCSISAQADVPDVEVTQHGISIPGVPAGAAAFLSGGSSSSGATSTTVSFKQSLPDLNLPQDLTSTVKAVKVDFIAKDGIKDFSFVQGLRVTMTPKGSTAVTELINYQKNGVTNGKTLSIDSQNPVNILDQWKTDSATFTVEVMGDLPTAAWTFDMAVHFSGQVTYKY